MSTPISKGPNGSPKILFDFIDGNSKDVLRAARQFRREALRLGTQAEAGLGNSGSQEQMGKEYVEAAFQLELCVSGGDSSGQSLCPAKLHPYAAKAISTLIETQNRAAEVAMAMGLLNAWTPHFGEDVAAWPTELGIAFNTISNCVKNGGVMEKALVQGFQGLRTMRGVHPENHTPLATLAYTSGLTVLKENGYKALAENLLAKLPDSGIFSDVVANAAYGIASDPAALMVPIAAAQAGHQLAGGTLVSWLKRMGASEEFIKGTYATFGFIGEVVGFVEGGNAFAEVTTDGELPDRDLGKEYFGAGSFLGLLKIFGAAGKEFAGVMPKTVGGQATAKTVADAMSIIGLAATEAIQGVIGLHDGEIDGTWNRLANAFFLHYGLKTFGGIASPNAEAVGRTRREVEENYRVFKDFVKSEMYKVANPAKPATAMAGEGRGGVEVPNVVLSESKNDVGGGTTKAETTIQKGAVQVSEPQVTSYLKVEVTDTELVDVLQSKVAQTNPDAEHQTPADNLHITVVSYAEIGDMERSLVAEEGMSKSKARKQIRGGLKDIETIGGKPVITGIGKATDPKTGHEVYFGTVEWPEAQAVRKQLGLPAKDLHITLASTAPRSETNPLPRDVHGVPKKPNVEVFEKTTTEKTDSRPRAGQTGFTKNDLELNVDHLERHLESNPTPGTKIHVDRVADIRDQIEGEIGENGEVKPFTLPTDINDPRLMEYNGSVFILVKVKLKNRVAQPGVIEKKNIPAAQQEQIYLGERVDRNGSYYTPMYKGKKVLTDEATLVIYYQDGDARPETGKDGKVVWKSGGQETTGKPVYDGEGNPVGIRYEKPELVTILAGPSDALHPSNLWLRDMILPKLKGAISKPLYDKLESTSHNTMDISEAGNIAKVWAEVLEKGVGSEQVSNETVVHSVVAELTERANKANTLWSDNLVFVGDGKPYPKESDLPPEVTEARRNLKKLKTSVSSEGKTPSEAKAKVKSTTSTFSRWAERIVTVAKELGDAALLKRAEAVKDQVESGTADDKAIKSELSTLNKEIKTKQKAKPKKKPKADKTTVEPSDKLSPKDLALVGELEAAGVVEPGFADQLEAHLKVAPDSKKNISKRLKGASGKIRKKDLVSAYTAIQGLIFELSRIQSIGEAMGGLPETIERDSGIEVEYWGFNKKGLEELTKDESKAQNDAPITKKRSKVQNDVPIIKGHIWETKRYPRKAIGETPQGEVPVTKNQLLKYQAAVKSGAYEHATIEVSGNVSPDYIKLAKERAEDVEILYALKLENGYEVVFPIKEASAGHRSLKRLVGPISALSARNSRILKGIQKILEFGKISKILTPNILKPKDVAGSPKETQLLDAGLDPKNIKDVETFREFERLAHEKRLKIFEDFADYQPTHRSPAIYLNPITDEVVDKKIRICEKHIEDAPTDGMRDQYTAPESLKDSVREELARRLRMVATFESTRHANEDPTRQAEREAMGYSGPPGGYPQDPIHVYMDVIKSVKKEIREAKKAGKKRPKNEPEQPFEVRHARSYDISDVFPTAEQLAAEMRDGKHQEVTVKYTVKYPAGEMEDIPVAREYDVTDAKIREKLLRDILGNNIRRLNEMRKKGLITNTRRIKEAHKELMELKAEIGEAVKKVPHNKRGEVARSFVKRSKEAREKILEAYKKSMGPRFEKETTRVIDTRKDNVRKYIYAVQADGTMKLYEESIKPGSERPAHSTLTGGRNVYGAGQIFVRGLKVISIDNGSGHYRPDAKENIDYVKATLAKAGFDTSESRPEHIHYPFVSIDTPVEELWFNDFFKEASKKAESK